MRLTALAAVFSLLVIVSAPVLAGPPGCVGPDSDGDLIDDCADNCSDVSNDLQFDADGDLCGNVCDTDWNNSGLIGFDDFGGWALAFGGTDANFLVLQPHTGNVGFADFGQWALAFGGAAGPSGTTASTTACP